MNESALAVAQRALKIGDVYLHDMAIVRAESFDARVHQVSQANFQWGPKGIQTVELEVEQPGPSDSRPDPIHLWRVLFFTVCRVLWPREEPIPSGFKPEAKDVALEIQATFVAEYQLQPMVDEAALLEFARHNVSYHVWPYWRELLHDVSARLRIAPVTLPMHSVRASREEEIRAEPAAEEKQPIEPR